MAKKRSVWLTGLFVGVASSMIVGGVDSWIGGARLRNGKVTVDQSLAPDLDGIVKIQPRKRTSVHSRY